MKFVYNSTNGGQRTLPSEEVQRLRDYLESCDGGLDWKKGQLHDVLLAYRTESGKKLMINQLEPIFVYVSRHGELWPNEQESPA